MYYQQAYGGAPYPAPNYGQVAPQPYYQPVYYQQPPPTPPPTPPPPPVAQPTIVVVNAGSSRNEGVPVESTAQEARRKRRRSSDHGAEPEHWLCLARLSFVIGLMGLFLPLGWVLGIAAWCKACQSQRQWKNYENDKSSQSGKCARSLAISAIFFGFVCLLGAIAVIIFILYDREDAEYIGHSISDSLGR